MIRRLRIKFMVILMSVVTLILLALFAAMLFSTRQSAKRMSEGMLRQALLIQSNQQGPPISRAEGGVREFFGMMPPDGRTSALIAHMDENGKITLQFNPLHYIEEQEAIEAAALALHSAEGSGILGDYALRYLKSDDGRSVALCDISMEQQMLTNLIIDSMAIGGAALMAFFLVSLFLSRWAVRPVALAWERQRQFVADASHELKTPLTVILSNADLLGAQGASDEEKNKKRVEHIRAEAGRMRSLVDELLTLAGSDRAKSLRVKEPVDLSFITMNAILTFEPIIYDEKKHITHSVQENLLITGDAQRLQQLISILLDNAVKYCPKHGQIQVTLRPGEHKSAILCVINDGESIPKDELSRIFERFYRLDKSRSANGGFGLGLAIAESIAHEHNGKIWAENTSTPGNRFTVTFPLR